MATAIHPTAALLPWVISPRKAPSSPLPCPTTTFTKWLMAGSWSCRQWVLMNAVSRPCLPCLGPVIRPNLGRIVIETLFWLDRAGKLKRAPTSLSSRQRSGLSASALPRTEAWDVIPDLAVEVISESNGANEISIKLIDYFKAGVQQVWVVYPHSRQVYVYTCSPRCRSCRRPRARGRRADPRLPPLPRRAVRGRAGERIRIPAGVSLD